MKKKTKKNYSTIGRERAALTRKINGLIEGLRILQLGPAGLSLLDKKGRRRLARRVGGR
jgi:hypothetical protein